MDPVQFVLLSFLRFFPKFHCAVDIAPIIPSLGPTIDPTRNNLPYSCQKGNLQIQRSNNRKDFL